MLKAAIIYLMKIKYHNNEVFLPNFSNFDSVFLLTVMTDVSDQIQPVLRDGNYIDLILKFAGKYKLYFRDSYLILPSSLRSLAKNFNVENKGLFPYRFIKNENISLNYCGPVPSIDYFYSAEEYANYSKEFINKDWNLRYETEKYCELDCVVLFKLIDKFSDFIFLLFRIDILKYPTLSSLAFAIYRTKILKDEFQIPLIHGEIYNFIKKYYTGGSVDVYKPIIDDNSEKENKVFRYDVNSLYPFAMKEFPMPSGSPIFFEDDILKSSLKIKPFGIFEAEVTCPETLKTPLLQLRIKTVNGYSTISPVGNWTSYYSSEELYNAEKYGYTFKVKRGYLFEKANIFTDYVEFLYDLKKNSQKGTPNYIISKLLLNRLYGRLGMNPISEQHKIITNEKAKDLYSKINVTNVLDLKNGKELISFFNIPMDGESENDFYIKNISVVVSSMVTASARIHMSQFKTDKNLIIYYTDTDSIDIYKELDQKFVGENLGQMKLEHVFDDVVFLAPKVYGGGGGLQKRV